MITFRDMPKLIADRRAEVEREIERLRQVERDLRKLGGGRMTVVLKKADTLSWGRARDDRKVEGILDRFEADARRLGVISEWQRITF